MSNKTILIRAALILQLSLAWAAPADEEASYPRKIVDFAGWEVVVEMPSRENNRSERLQR